MKVVVLLVWLEIVNSQTKNDTYLGIASALTRSCEFRIFIEDLDWVMRSEFMIPTIRGIEYEYSNH